MEINSYHLGDDMHGRKRVLILLGLNNRESPLCSHNELYHGRLVSHEIHLE